MPAAGAAGSAPKAVAKVEQPDYVIGPNDLLSIVFWRDKDMSADVVVRPDGKISLPLIGAAQAAGQSADGLARQLEQRYRGIVEGADDDVGPVPLQVGAAATVPPRALTRATVASAEATVT